jgi:hypothetical protein
VISRSTQPDVPRFGGTTLIPPVFPETTACNTNVPFDAVIAAVLTAPIVSFASLYLKPVFVAVHSAAGSV